MIVRAPATRWQRPGRAARVRPRRTTFAASVAPRATVPRTRARPERSAPRLCRGARQCLASRPSRRRRRDWLDPCPDSGPGEHHSRHHERDRDRRHYPCRPPNARRWYRGCRRSRPRGYSRAASAAIRRCCCRLLRLPSPRCWASSSRWPRFFGARRRPPRSRPGVGPQSRLRGRTPETLTGSPPRAPSHIHPSQLLRREMWWPDV
mmetsp:Transcript_25122/g.62876  ORF Transcript_25122/g.62876 Transcript_25122/m.62876 type:complete len:206 (-) Transcript_25122:1745-2362(-)